MTDTPKQKREWRIAHVSSNVFFKKEWQTLDEKNCYELIHVIEYSAYEQAIKERDAYKKAKEENDERFMHERDEARAEVKRLRFEKTNRSDAKIIRDQQDKLLADEVEIDRLHKIIIKRQDEILSQDIILTLATAALEHLMDTNNNNYTHEFARTTLEQIKRGRG